jgi:hypothetical protein
MNTAPAPSTALVTELPFTLPHGYDDGEGGRHRNGVMRMATAYDEIAPMKDPRVQANSAYLVIILLSRVIVRLGELEQVTPKTVEGLYAGDLAYLQDFYLRINQSGHSRMAVSCPHCEENCEVDIVPDSEAAALGPSTATPSKDSSRR